MHIRPLLFTTAIIVISALSAPALAANPGNAQAITPPPLALQDLGGRAHSLESYRGQVVLINFWASWCPPCLVEMPSMQRLRDSLPGRPFTILAINAGESPATAWRSSQQMHTDFTILLDPDKQAVSDWGVKVFPSSFLVNRDGQLIEHMEGMRKWDDPAYIRRIDALSQQ